MTLLCYCAMQWLCKDDYLRGGYRMLSGIDPTGRRTAVAALRNAVYLLPLGAAAWSMGLTTQVRYVAVLLFC